MDTSLDADVLHTILRITVILTYDLLSRIIVSGAYLYILFDVGIPNLLCWFLLGWLSGAYHLGSLLP